MAQGVYNWLSEPERYRRLREKLIMYFSRRGFSNPEDLADETIMRGLKRLAEGTTLTVPPEAFIFGIARNVAREAKRRDQGLEQFDEETPTPKSKADPFAELLQKEVDQEAGKCLRQCWQALTPEERKIYHSFYGEWATADERDKEREKLAGQIGVSLSGFRSRGHQIRKRLIRCVRRCLEKKSAKQIPLRDIFV